MYILLILGSTLLDELFNSSGKRAVSKHKETTYSLGFLNSFGAVVAFGIAALLGVSLHFSISSLPTLIPRIAIEILSAHLVIKAIQKTDRSTFGFFGLMVAPLLVIADLALGFGITPYQIMGVVGISLILLTLAHDHSLRLKGSGLLLFIAITNAITISLYKYDIAHYNSVVAEQLIVTSFILFYFWLNLHRLGHKSAASLLLKPLSLGQTSSKGLALMLKSYAFSVGPGAVVAVAGSSFSLMWSVLFGKTYFHEKHISHKLVGCGATIVALFLMYSAI
jgi:hypothetical protein